MKNIWDNEQEEGCAIGFKNKPQRPEDEELQEGWKGNY